MSDVARMCCKECAEKHIATIQADNAALRAALAESCEAVTWMLESWPASDDPGPGIRSDLARWRTVLAPASGEGRADAAGEG